MHDKNGMAPTNQVEQDLEQRLEKARRNSKTGVIFMVAGGGAAMLSQRLMAQEGVFIVLGLVAMLAGWLVLGSALRPSTAPGGKCETIWAGR